MQRGLCPAAGLASAPILCTSPLHLASAPHLCTLPFPCLTLAIFQDICYSICYIGTGEFLLPYGDQGGCQAWTAYHEIINPLVCAIPLWCRFLQCLRVAHDSKKRVPALPNALKYSISLLVVLFGEMHPSLVASALGEPDRLQWMHLLWMAVYLCGYPYRGLKPSPSSSLRLRVTASCACSLQSLL